MNEIMKLCCIFNYAPDYRKAIYQKIDNTFDTQFYFGREVEENKISGIPKIDYSIFKKEPIEIKNKTFLKNRIWWRTGIQCLPFKQYNVYIITGDLSYSYIPFLLNCKILGKKTYAWGHGFKKSNKWSWKLACIFIKLLTGFFVYGDYGRNCMIAEGMPSEKLFTIYNSLDRKCEFKEYEQPLYREIFGNDFPILIFIGRLTKVKQLDWIIKALADHKEEGLRYNLIIIGDGMEKANLQSLCKNLDITENVHFYGSCHDENEIAPMIYNADLCVSPGNVGLTAIHCMRYGTPVLSHDDFLTQMPEYETIIIGKTGDLYKCGNFEDFKEKIKNWIISPKDRNVIREQCQNIINTVWNADHQIDIIKRVLNFNE